MTRRKRLGVHRELNEGSEVGMRSIASQATMFNREKGVNKNPDFFRRTDAASALEYRMMIALIIAVLVSIVVMTGVKVESVFQRLSDFLSRPPFA